MPTPVTIKEAIEAFQLIDQAIAVAEIRMTLPQAAKLGRSMTTLLDFLKQAETKQDKTPDPQQTLMP